MKKTGAISVIKSSIPILISIFLILFVVGCNLPTTSRAVPPSAPAAPSLTAGTGQITVNWTAVDKATSYEVWWNNANDTATAAKYGSDCVLTVTVINGVPDGFTYWVWIKAKNRFGTSAADYKHPLSYDQSSCKE